MKLPVIKEPGAGPFIHSVMMTSDTGRKENSKTYTA